MSEQDKSRVQEAAFKLGYVWSHSKDNVTNLQAGYYYLNKDGILGWDWPSSGDFFDRNYGRQIYLQQLLTLAGMEDNMTTKQFTKSDLVAGKHVVEFRDKTEGLHLYLSDDILVDTTGFVSLEYMENDLSGMFDDCFTIVSVYEIVRGFNLSDLSDGDSMTLIWKREEKSATQIELEKLQEQIADLQSQANKLQSAL